MIGAISIEMAATLGLTITLITFGAIGYVALKQSAKSARFNQRLSILSQRFKGHSDPQKLLANEIMLQHNKDAASQFFAQWIPNKDALAIRLSQTGRAISISNFLAGIAAIFSLTLILLSILTGLPLALNILCGLLAALVFPHITINKMIKNRKKAFLTLMPDATDLIVRGLKSGLPINESIANVASEINEPIRSEFRLIADQMKLGTSLEDALWAASKRVALPEFQFFVVCIAIQKETGGNLAETLKNLSNMVRKRHQMQLKIKAMSAEGRASASIVGILPFAMFGLILSINYDYASILFTDPRAIIISIASLIWMSLGIVIMAKMVSFEI